MSTTLCTILLLLPTVTKSLTEKEMAMFKPKNVTEKYSGEKPMVMVEEEDNALKISFNAIPHHYTGQWDGQTNDSVLIKAQNMSITVIRHPKKYNSVHVNWCLPFGIIGVTTGGIPIYNPYAPEKGCKPATEVEKIDACGGRTDEKGMYHYYSYSMCAGGFMCNQTTEIYGVAIDGFPIYGPYDEYGEMITGNDLDECGGRIDHYGNYRYHIVLDTEPGIVYCLKGEFHPKLAETLRAEDFICNCPYSDDHFTEPKICEEEPSADDTTADSDQGGGQNETTEDKGNQRRRRSAVVLVTKRDSPEITDNSTDSNSTNVTAVEEEKKRDCITPEELEEMYSTETWGGFRIKKSSSICNFTNPHNIVICDINQTKWESRPSWKYEEKAVDSLACCPVIVNISNSCSDSCWVTRKSEEVADHVNPNCSTKLTRLHVKRRVMVPNSARGLYDSYAITILTVLLFLDYLH